MQCRGREWSRGRAPQLGSYPTRNTNPRPGRGGSFACKQGHCAIEWTESAWIPLAVMGPYPTNVLSSCFQRGTNYNKSLYGRGLRAVYPARRGDVAKVGEPFHFGEQTELIEMPISWSLDNYPHFEFVRAKSTILAGLQSARAVLQNWFDEFLYMKKTGRVGRAHLYNASLRDRHGYRMLALEQMVDKLGDEGAVFMTLENAAREAEQRLTAKPI